MNRLIRYGWRTAPVAAALALSFSLVSGVAHGSDQAHAGDALDPANPHFQQRWERTDQPVADLAARRTWMWGPGAFTGSITEPYAESPNGYRQVQYFDKARMEINQPDAHAPNLWYVTTGRLAWELATGSAQFGDDTFKNWLPAEINVAGDLDDPNAPTYASLGTVLDVTEDFPGAIENTIDRDGTIRADTNYLKYEIGVYEFSEVTRHWIANPFWEFMTSEGLVYQDGKLMEDELFIDPFYATGHPITDPYWTRVLLDGEPTDVLVQAFERRVLTYTPSNPDGWKVESGNIGQHYYQWYYGPHPEQ
jgi:hypothetical protein